MVTLRNQAPGRIMLGQQQVQLKELQPGEDVNLITRLSVHVRVFLSVTCSIHCDFVSLPVPCVSKQVSTAALTPAQKSKLKEAGGTFK